MELLSLHGWNVVAETMSGKKVGVSTLIKMERLSSDL